MRLLLQRYLAGQFIMPLIVSTVFFICFMLTFQLFRMTEMLVTRDISLSFVLGLLGDISLTFIPMSLPIAVFFSTIYCLSRFCSDSEYIAMRAGGMTKGKILAPFLLVSGLLSVSVYHLNQEIIPHSQKEFARKLNLLISSGMLAGIKEGQFFNEIPNVTMFATRATKYGRNLEEVFLHFKEEKGQRVIQAARGELIPERQENSGLERLTLKLFDGNIIGKKGNGDIEKILFKQYDFPVSQNQLDLRVSIKETMLSSGELSKALSMTPEQAEKKYSFNQKDLFNARYEFWNRKNGALICFIFCFLGFALGIKGNRGKGTNSGFIGLMTLILYYAMFFSLVSMARKGTVPMPVAVFLPSLVVAGIGFRFYRKLDWQS
ncbi:MAG: LptF/LptG family permease [Bacteriovoracaceae bacterium]|jgi:lipopolysaccharide export LptBFGC system permease protein LptF